MGKAETENEQNPAKLTQSVRRATRILSCFSDQTPELRVTDISLKLDLTPSLVSRLLATLEYDGYVEQDPATGLYRLGRMILTLAGVALNHNQLRRIALSEMQAASSHLGLGVNLAVLDGDSMFYLAHLETPENPRPYTLIGRHNPLHATGMGKVLLAFLPEVDALKLLKTLPLNSYTANTCTSIKALKAELAQVRKQGWGIELEELALGRACVAGPLRDASGHVVGALSFSGPLSQFRWTERKSELTSTIVELCDRISMRLGYITAPRVR